MCTISLWVRSGSRQLVSWSCFPPGQRGLFTTSSGLQIAYLGGAYDRKNFTASEGGSGEANLVGGKQFIT